MFIIIGLSVVVLIVFVGGMCIGHKVGYEDARYDYTERFIE